MKNKGRVVDIVALAACLAAFGVCATPPKTTPPTAE